MRWFILFCLCCLFAACSQKDILIENHPLLATKIQNPDYVLAVANLPLGYSGSQKLHHVNNHLFGIDEVFRLGHSIDNRDLVIKEIFPKGETSLEVKKVYMIKLGFPASLFNRGTSFAILEDENKNQYTVSLFQNKPMLELNKCELSRQCTNRIFLLETIFKDKNKKYPIFIDYLPDSKKNQKIEESNKEFADFLKSKNILVIEDLKYRPSLVVEVDYIQYGNLMLYSSIFNIQNVSSYQKEN